MPPYAVIGDHGINSIKSGILQRREVHLSSYGMQYKLILACVHRSSSKNNSEYSKY